MIARGADGADGGRAPIEPVDEELDDRRRWNDRYRARAASDTGSGAERAGPLARLLSVLPTEGRAIDLAGGDGGVARFLAARGLSATVVDVSDVALERAAASATAADLDVTTHRLDLAGRSLGQVLGAVLGAVGPPAPTVVTCFNYLDRALLASVADGLPTGCRFLTAVATTTNLERNDRPGPRFLLDPGELVELVAGGADRLRILHRREGWADGRHRSELAVVAR